MTDTGVLCVGELPPADVTAFLARYGLEPVWVDPGDPIPASFWGAPEAGIAGRRVYLRADTPVHSMLHETCHIICMTDDRRDRLERDAGGDDLEEAAVCYLQIVLADVLPGVGRATLMQDMDRWGYSFRLGNTSSWFTGDADDARRWLQEHGLLDVGGDPVFRLRSN